MHEEEQFATRTTRSDRVWWWFPYGFYFALSLGFAVAQPSLLAATALVCLCLPAFARLELYKQAYMR